MKRLLCLLAVLTLGACASTANGWPHRHTVLTAGACAQGSAYADGCLGANQNAMYEDLNWYTDGVFLTTYNAVAHTYISPHPFPWNAPGLDYPVGPDVKYGTTVAWKDPTTAYPVGCSYSLQRLGGGPTMRCPMGSTIDGYDFSNTGSHPCISLELTTGTGTSNTTTTITNNKFVKNDPLGVTAGCETATSQIGMISCAATNTVVDFEHNYFDDMAYLAPGATPTLESQVHATPTHMAIDGCASSHDIVEYNYFRNPLTRVWGSSSQDITTGGVMFKYNLVWGMNVDNHEGCIVTTSGSSDGSGDFTISNLGDCVNSPPKIAMAISKVSGATCGIPGNGYTTIDSIISNWDGTSGSYVGSNKTTVGWTNLTCNTQASLHGELGFMGANHDLEFNTMVWTQDSYTNTVWDECQSGLHSTFLYNCIDKNNVMIFNKDRNGTGPAGTAIIAAANSPYNIFDIEQNYIDTYGMVNNICGGFAGGGFTGYSGVISDNGTADSVPGNVFGVTTANSYMYSGNQIVTTSNYPSGKVAPTIQGGGITGHISVTGQSSGTPGGVGNYTVDDATHYVVVSGASSSTTANDIPPIAAYTWANNINMVNGNTELPNYVVGSAGCN